MIYLLSKNKSAFEALSRITLETIYWEEEFSSPTLAGNCLRYIAEGDMVIQRRINGAIIVSDEFIPDIFLNPNNNCRKIYYTSSRFYEIPSVKEVHSVSIL